MSKQIVYVDMDGVVVHFPESIDDLALEIREVCRQWCESTGNHHSDFEGIFATLQPKDGAAEAIDRLLSRFEVYFLSTSPWANTGAWSDKRRWVEEHLPGMSRKHLILSHRKDLNRGAYLIDDRPNNGAREFGEHAGQEWIHFGSEDFPDWETVLTYLQC